MASSLEKLITKGESLKPGQNVVHLFGGVGTRTMAEGNMAMFVCNKFINKNILF
jgi:hypothetical protein